MRRVSPRAHPALWGLIALAMGLAAFMGTATLSVSAGASPVVTGASRSARSAGSVPSSSAPSGCPASDHTIPTSTRDGATESLVPSGADGLLVCRYGGLSEPGSRETPFGLVGGRVVTDIPTVTRLAGELNAIAPTDDAYPIACPADFGQTLVAYFEYSSGPEDPVSVDLGGCQPISNGPVSRLALGAPVVNQLSALVPSVQTGPGPVIPPHGTIAVTVQVCGGAAPGRCRPPSRSCLRMPGCYPALHVVAVRSGVVVAAERVRRGHFTLSVAPGPADVELRQGGTGLHGELLERFRVTVRAARVTRVRVVISVK